MDTRTIIARLSARAEAIRSKGATALFIYGSRSRDEGRPDSDLDVFVEHDPGQVFSLIDLAAVKHAIEDEIGLPVDITTRDSLNPKLKRRIEAEALRVF